MDQIDGLSPAISIDQKTTAKNPRSTVGTVTEIYDYLRLLWARVRSRGFSTSATISSTLCWLVTRPHTGQWGTPMRAYIRRR